MLTSRVHIWSRWSVIIYWSDALIFLHSLHNLKHYHLNRARTDLGTDFGQHPVHCRLNQWHWSNSTSNWCLQHISFDIASLLSTCVIASALACCQLHYGKGIWPIKKHCHLPSEVLVQNKWRQRMDERLAKRGYLENGHQRGCRNVITSTDYRIVLCTLCACACVLLTD